MDLKSVSAFRCYVRDLDASEKFYQTLGFRSGKRDAEQVTFYLNWFSIELRLAGDMPVDNQQAGMAVLIKVGNVSEYRAALAAKGLQPTESEKQPSGAIECTLLDPDGYRLVFFEK